MIVHPELKIKFHLLLADDINDLYNVCSVHRGMFSILGCVQYIEGYHEYIGRISSAHRGDTMSTSEGYHEYIGGCSVHQRDTMSTSGDIMST